MKGLPTIKKDFGLLVRSSHLKNECMQPTFCILSVRAATPGFRGLKNDLGIGTGKYKWFRVSNDNLVTGIGSAWRGKVVKSEP